MTAWDEDDDLPPPALGTPEWLAAWRSAVAQMSVRITGPVVQQKAARAAVRSSVRQSLR